MSWERFQRYYLPIERLGCALDVSRVDFPDDYLMSMASKMEKAFQEMEALERGAIANPDENRRVGHYWLRAPERAPSPDIRQAIKTQLTHIHDFSCKVHSGQIQGAKGPFEQVLLIGIGGSALGPQFIHHAFDAPLNDKLRFAFFDNTDPEGMDCVWAQLDEKLGQTLVLVISKSGTTPETRNGMLEAEAAYTRKGLSLGAHAVAVTGEGSQLDCYASDNRWLARFPMWDWIGGRTSVFATVGLLPAALQGIDIEALLAGARQMDEVTRLPDMRQNPAALIALMWYYLTDGRGTKDMVVLPYKDRLEYFSRYLQQLVMESLGKEQDRDGKVVHQGITVYGNKGSTDQHAYVQQLREGIPNFFVTFIEVLKDRQGPSLEVEPETTSGDCLHGFFLGTREALYEKGRPSITLTLREITAHSVGGLIALFERAVGLYASLINVNAYHQPGVEAGKQAAADVLTLQRRILQWLQARPGTTFTLEEIAQSLDFQKERLFKILEHLSANPEKQIRKISDTSLGWYRYGYK